MGNLFDMDNKFVVTMNRILSLIGLNLLWILTSIPLVTAGASSCALYTMTRKIIDGEEGYIVGPFLQYFKKYWKKVTPVWCIELVAGIILFLDIRFWQMIENPMALAMRGLTITLTCLYAIVVLYTIPLFVHTQMKKRIIRTAALLGIKYLPQSLFLILWGAIFIIGSKIWALAALLVFFIGVSLFSVLHNKMMKTVWQKETAKQESGK